jgi:hypothetical protein
MEERLAGDNLTYFHAVDFAHSRNEFSGWKEQEPRRRKLLSDLMELIKRHAYLKFGSIVVNAAFREHVSEEIMEQPKTSDLTRIRPTIAAGAPH